MRKHQVKQGDTLTSIAQQYLYNSARALEIRDINNLNSDVVTVGQVLTIPDSDSDAREPVEFEGIGITIDDKKFEFFTSFNMKFDLDSLAPVFNFSVPYESTNADFREAFEPYSYKTLKVYYKDALVLTGTITQHDYNSEADANTVDLSGYGLPGILQEVTLPKSAYPRQKKRVNLRTIAQEYCNLFGIKIDSSSEAGEAMSRQFSKVQIDTSQNIAEFLVTLAVQRGLIISTTPEGVLFFTYNNIADREPVFDIQPGAYNISATYNGSALYSHITAMTSANLKKKSKTAKEKIDLDVFRHKTIGYQNNDDGDLLDFIKSEIGRTIIESQSFSFSLPFWTDTNGKIFQPRDIITINEPSVRIENTTEFIIKSVEFNVSAEAESANFTVIPRSALNNELEKFWQ